jgi:hypothetical protein
LLITFWIGGRELEDARQMLHDLVKRAAGRKPLFVSDELPHYANILAELYHEMVPVAPTGKRGRPRNPQCVIDPDLDYATVHKTREGGRITEVSCRVIFGTEESVERRLVNSPSRKINTSYVERSNLDWRIWDAHLVRKSPTVARSIRWLKAKFAICVSFYNLIRPHGTLSRGQDRIFRPKTPAMAASVTDHPWSVRELLEYAVPCQ